MSLLREIQGSAIDSKAGIASLLRKCKVLAARLGSPEFRTWVDNELSGYKNIEDLPDYRILHVISKGHFAGPFNSGMNNADIPLSCLPEEFREIMSRSNIWSRLLPLKLSLLNLTAVPANNLGIRILLPWLARKFIKT